MKKKFFLFFILSIFVFCSEENEESKSSQKDTIENEQAEFLVDTLIILNNKVAKISYEELEEIVKTNVSKQSYPY
jgi:hypothetical protein